VFSDLAKQFDAAGDGERAILALERLVAIDPTEEERHRRLLALEARYRGADAALARGRELAVLLKREVDAAPERATLALLEEIRRKSEMSADVSAPTNRSASEPPAPRVEASADRARNETQVTPPRWLRWLPELLGAPRVGLMASLALLAACAGVFWIVAARTPPDQTPIVAAAPDPWKSPPLPSRAADESIARGRGLVAIAVLPFRLYSENGNGGTLAADMVTDDLTYLLSHIPVFRVISRQTASSYRGQDVDAAAIGAELGVHYLVEGNVSVHGSILRVNVALVDTKTRLQIWTGRFERTGEDRHAMQTEILNGLARELHVSVSKFENSRLSKDPSVHALIFKGLAAIQESRLRGVEGLRPAEGYFHEALKRDPGAIRAQVGLGAFHAHMAVQLFAPDPAPHLTKAEAILQQVIERHPDVSEAYPPIGLIHVARRQMKKAKHAFQRAIEINPSDAPSYAQLGRALASLGDPKAGLAHIRYAMKLSPRDPILGYWLAFAGYAYLELERYEEAVDYLRRAHATNPTQPRTMLTYIAALAMAGRMNEARLKLEHLRQVHPHMTRETILRMYKDVGGRIRTTEGIRRVLAGENSEHSAATK
jgi:TolB-like protein/Flp pilus assembly protein TadD